MRQFIIPTCSPKSFSGGRTQRQRDVVADAFAVINALAEASRAKTAAASQHEGGERYDAGLVHEHGWARTTSC